MHSLTGPFAWSLARQDGEVLIMLGERTCMDQHPLKLSCNEVTVLQAM